MDSGKTEKNVITQTFFFVYLKIKEENSPIAVICPVLHMIDGYRRINDMSGAENQTKELHRLTENEADILAELFR